MNEHKRVVFTFDPATLERLEAIKVRRGYETLGEALSDVVWTYDALLAQEDEGFTEVTVRNPRTDRERVMRTRPTWSAKIVEDLKSLSREDR